jgi:hypothetical protein
MTIDELRAALERLRMDRQLTYERLAFEISKGDLTTGTIRNFITAKTEPHPFTISKVREFLKAHGVEAAA